MKRLLRITAVALALIAAATLLGGPTNAAPARSTLVVAQGGDVDSLDNEKSLGPSKGAIILCSDWQPIGYKPLQLKNGLWTVDTKTFAPRIFERWEHRAVGGRHEYTLYVKRGLQHQSGNPITAHDVAFSFLRRQAFGRDALERTIGFFAANRDLQVVDDYTVRISASRFSPMFFNMFTQRNIYDSRRVRELAGPQDPWGEEYLKRNCVGGGPYKMTRWTPGVEMSFERWPEWWGNSTWEKTTIGNISLRIVPELATRILLLQRGQVDVALDIPSKEISRLRTSRGVKVLSYPSQNLLYIGINPNIKPFDNVKLRRALAHAFPYAQAIQDVYGGDAQRLNGALPTGVPLARKVAAYSTDLDRAKRMLAEAGYPNGIEISVMFDSRLAAHEDLAVMYKASLEKIGVRLNIQKMPSAQFNAELRTRRLPFFFYEALWWISDPLYMISLSFHTRAQTNVSGYGGPRTDEMIDRANVTDDDRARLRLLNQIQDVIIDDVAWIFLAQPNFNIAVRDNIDRYVHQNTELNHLWLLQKK
ncbi:MAG: ABC transporter substrate-binding protein [Armatimonadetes bacterium]|nr:ABC transporter substrate-binding protein [Armatimonadota bacterium]